MQFEWNREKAQTNIKKHKVSIEEAMTVFYDPFSATFKDDEHSMMKIDLLLLVIHQKIVCW